MLTKNELEHLKWVYERMQYVHKENPQYDYMLKFRHILNKEDVAITEYDDEVTSTPLGYIEGLPQFGRFKRNTKYRIYVEEVE